jgi:hypothetical protein
MLRRTCAPNDRYPFGNKRYRTEPQWLLLIVGADKDQTVPASVARAQYK